MHPKNKYKDARPDFTALAAKYPALAPHVNDGRIDFTDSAALRALTTALLKEDFELDVELRDDRLCPTVANRLDYTLLCLDLLPHLPSPPRPVRALDIGTGHVAIYALLLHRLRPDASIVATELDPISLAHARATVAATGAGEKVSVVEAPEGRIFPFSTPKPPISEEEAFNESALLSEDKASSSTQPPDMDDYYAFTMCNPPFFASADDVAASRALKSASPSAAPTAAINEEVTEGGEEEFIGRMIDESAHPDSRGRVGWYTSLVGRYESLRSLVPRVRAVTDNYYVVSLRQASTARWVLIWGFGAERLPDTMTRPAVLDPTTSFARLLPLPNTFSITPDPPRARGELAVAVLRALKESNLWPVAGTSTQPPIEPSTSERKAKDEDGQETNEGDESDVDEDDHIPLAPLANTWSRAARRAAQRNPDSAPAPNAEPLFRVRLRITGEDGEPGQVSLEWEWGRDREVVDTFWKFVLSKSGLLKRRADDGGHDGGRGGYGGRGGWRGRGGRERSGRVKWDEDGEDRRRGRADRAGHWRGGPVDAGWGGRGRGDRGRGRGGHAE